MQAFRNSDPVTSQLAADHIIRTGARAHQQHMAAAAVRAFPGRTSLELGQEARMCRFMLARRLPECEEAGTVYRGPVRKCRVSGRQAATWWSEPQQLALIAA